MPDKPGNPKISRKLAAILAADISGYSALMGANEEETVRDLRAHQVVVLPMIGEFGGRIIYAAGDGFGAEFSSVLSAVKCALAIQQVMAERNAPVDAAKRMQFRIGINLGDVVTDDTRVHGVGVHVAARLESIAEPGGICISSKVYDDIKGKVDADFEDCGQQSLKNVSLPIRVYRIPPTLRDSPTSPGKPRMTARQQRRLAAILAADIARYSALMGADEASTVRDLKGHQAVVLPMIAEHGGRIIDTAGDGILAEFGSVVNAVECAIAIQQTMAERNAQVEEPRRMQLRIGVNQGDVIHDETRVYGDGVNVAARLESIAEPGGICISAKVHDEIAGKMKIACQDFGMHQLKNITQPVRVYRIELLRNSPRSTLALPEKPSIAVLAFSNLSGDPEQEYFADGLVDDIITALSRFRGLFVIARNSSFTYKGKAINIKQVGRELGVRYVVEGSVRKAGSRLRITSQLIDVATAAHLWADRFDGALEDIFDLQDKVTQQVVGAIAPELDRAEIERASRRPAGSIDAVTAYYRGLHHTDFPTSPENNDAALRDFNFAIALDPSFVPAYGGAASCLAWRRANRWPSDIVKDNAELLRLAERVKELGTDDALTLSALGFNLFWVLLEFDRGLEMVERAIRSNPNCAQAYNLRGLLRAWHGVSDAAVADVEEAMRLSPRDPFIYNAMLGLALAHHNAGRHREAAEWTDKYLRAFPPSLFVGKAQSIAVYVGAGRLEDAKKLMAECLRLRPEWCRSTYVDPLFVRSPKLRAEFLEAFIKAGLPD